MILVLALGLWAGWPGGPAEAWDLKIGEWGGGAYYSTDFDISRGDLISTGALGFLATPLFQAPCMQLDLRLEASAANFWNYGSGLEVALVPSLRLYLLNGAKHGPNLYAEVGVGPSYNSMHIPEQGQGFNFLSFGGLGLRFRLPQACSLDLGYRIRHISNAGMNDVNGGVSCHMFMVELAWTY